MKRTLILAYTLFIFTYVTAQQMLTTIDATAMERWVDEQMAHLDTPEKQLGQLIMPLMYQGKGSYDTPETRSYIKRQVERYHIGGMLLSKSTITDHANLTNFAQQLAYEAGLPPLLVGVDGEWGLNMRMADAVKFPRNRSIGQISGAVRDTICYLYGEEVARQCRLMGIHVNFAPVLDIDSNPKNPVIGSRSFGATADLVSACGIYYAHGLEDGGVMSCAKHFPGHGDTDKDSHKTLPRLKYSKKQLSERELKPFGAYIDQELGGIMVAHLDVPKLTGKAGTPSSASRAIVHDLLQDEMGFKGLVFTDGLAMKGASGYPDICVKALLAGNDVLLQPTPEEKQWQAMLAAISDGRLSRKLIEEKCRRVLRWKYVLIMSQHPVVGVTSLPYPQIDTLGLVSRVTTDNARRLSDEMARLSNSKGESAIDPTLQNAIEQDQLASLAPASQLDMLMTDTLPPVPPIMLPTATPAEVGMDAVRLGEVSRLAEEAVTSGAAPGCQVVVIRHGKVVYDQTFGTQGGTPEQNAYSDRPITAETQYDLASMSKATATVPAVMLLVDDYGISLKDPVTTWLPELKGSRYAKVTLQDLLYHESGLQEGYPFYNMGYEPSDTLRDHLMLQKIAQLKPRKKRGQYLYSDLNFVLLRYVVERVSGRRIDDYLQQRLPDFYGPWLGYNPQEHGVPLSALAPTEQDDAVRHRFIHGTVHDEASAWAMGVEGNAGLFGSAESLAPLLQMLLNGGELNGTRYITAETCRKFTTTKSAHSRRGLGFDKPETRKGKTSPCADECSAQTWGHTGFTGTCFWVDPKQDLIYIFLSNRICPSRNNRRLLSLGCRSRIQSAIYQAIK